MVSPRNLPLAVATEGTRRNKTGLWGVMKPLFKEKKAPCHSMCPGGIRIPEFIDLVNKGDMEGAWRVILEDNPMPRITGRVCFHPCEVGCNREEYDRALAIQSLERFAGDYAFENGLDSFYANGSNDKKVAVVGGGPAGIGFSFYLSRLGYRVSLYEAMPEMGGVLRYGIPEYRLPKRILSEELDMVLCSGVEVMKGTKAGKDISWDELDSQYQGIFLGTGAQRPIKLGFKGEEQEGVIDGLAYLQTGGENTPIKPGAKVLILGGGNTAMDVARTVLRRKGIPIVLYRRTIEEMPAFEDEIHETQAEGIEIRFLVSPKAIIREEGRVKGLECIKNRSATVGKDGRRGFAQIDDSGFFLEGDLIISALGQAVELGDLPPDVNVKHDSVIVNAQGCCGPNGIYAGGDMTDMPRSVIHAINSGKQAALAMDMFLRKDEKFGAREEPDPPQVTLEDINLAYFEQAQREEPAVQSAQDRISDFGEVTRTFTPDEAARESSRCFGCGNCTACGNCYTFCPDFSVHWDSETMGVVFDEDYCKGCCICVEECPRGVLSSEVKK